jgi:cleavage stimulation factor subunit 2
VRYDFFKLAYCCHLNVTSISVYCIQVLANKLGMDLSQQTQRPMASSSSNTTPSSVGTNAVADALKQMTKGEMYDITKQFKEIADRDPEEARRLLSGHPQLPEAMLFLMSKLDMVQTSVSTDAVPGVLNALPGTGVGIPASRAADPRVRDPRAVGNPGDPRAAPMPVAQAPAPPVSDPRARMDPRARAATAAPPIPPQPFGTPPPLQAAAPPPPPPQGVANLDPALIQQVMSLTPQQIAQLPPNKQQSILALRQQISGSVM